MSEKSYVHVEKWAMMQRTGGRDDVPPSSWDISDGHTFIAKGLLFQAAQEIILRHNAAIDRAVAAAQDRINKLEQEQVRRIRHLNRLGSWAQQDPTQPVPFAIQDWVLNEIKAALGSGYKEQEWQPEYLKLRDRLAAAQADTKRLDWLETKMFITESHSARGIHVGVDENVSPRETLRQAIDAAMNQKPK